MPIATRAAAGRPASPASSAAVADTDATSSSGPLSAPVDAAPVDAAPGLARGAAARPVAISNGMDPSIRWPSEDTTDHAIR